MAQCPSGEKALGGGYVIRTIFTNGFSTGNDAVRIDWAFAHDPYFDVLFTVDPTKLAAGQSIRVEAHAVCATAN